HASRGAHRVPAPGWRGCRADARNDLLSARASYSTRPDGRRRSTASGGHHWCRECRINRIRVMPVEYGRDDDRRRLPVTAVAPVTARSAKPWRCANVNPRMALAVPVVVDLRLLSAN